MFKEKEVDNLYKAIYEGTDQGTLAYDTQRFDVAAEKLEIFKNPSVKRQLKSRFVTG